MSSDLARNAVGAFVGSYFGPVGAQIGWMIGSYANGRINDDSQPQINELKLQTASYGVPIPLIIGKQRVSGNVIWIGPKSTYDIEAESGKYGSDQAIGTGYRLSFAIGLGVGPILGWTRVWADGKLLIDGTSAAVSGIGTFYTGSVSQTVDPHIEEVEGVGNVPAFRELSYIVCNQYDLGPSGRIPNFSFELLREYD